MLKRLLDVHILFLLLFATSHLGAVSGPVGPTLFTHVNVISMKTEGLLQDQTVIVQGSKIVRIGASKDINTPLGSTTIDGTGKYLIPGLADLHVHLFSSDDLLSYVAKGVTTVLNMDGGPMHLQWRDEVRRGTLIGPEIYTAGHTVDGYPPLNEMFLTAETAQAARAIVHQQKQEGYDAIKVYGTLRPEVFHAILEAAQKEGIPVVGHINRQVGAIEVLKSSQVLAAHLEDLIFARFDKPPNESELEEFATEIAASHMTVTPNLNVNPSNIAQLQDLNAVLKSPDATLLPPAAYSQWLPANNRNERNDSTAQQIDQMKQIQKILYRLVTSLRSKGVRLVLGTDAAPYGFPGLSVHQELRELVDAGFTPYEALLTATQNSGSFIADNLVNASHFGTITQGSRADLVLLSGNPLSNIDNTKEIVGVMLNGRWLPLNQLQAMRELAVIHATKVKATLDAVDSELEAGNVERAKEYAEPLGSEKSQWIAEWVLMTKARKLEAKDLSAAIAVATWSATLYPSSFSAHYLLADVLFKSRRLVEAKAQLTESLLLEPNNAAALNLAAKIDAFQQPLKFKPKGSYQIRYRNDQSGDTRNTTLMIEVLPSGQLGGKQLDAGVEGKTLDSVIAGGERIWAVGGSQSGPIEFRIVVSGNNLSGYWDSPYGSNGHLTGSKGQ